MLEGDISLSAETLTEGQGCGKFNKLNVAIAEKVKSISYTCYEKLR